MSHSLDSLGGDQWAELVDRGLGALGVCRRLLLDGLQLADAIGQALRALSDQAVLDRRIEPHQLGGGLRGSLAQLGHVGAPALDPVLAPVQHVAHEHAQPVRLKQAALQMIDHGCVELVHRHGDAGAAGLAHAGLGRAGVIAIAPVLTGAQGHGPAAKTAKADAAQEHLAGDEPRGHAGWAAELEVILHRLPFVFGDDGRDLGHRVLLVGLAGAVFVVGEIESVLALVGRAGQHLVNRVDAEPAAVLGSDVVVVEPGGDGFEAQGTRAIYAEQGELIDAADLLGLDGVDLQLLLELGPALFGDDDAIAEWWARAIPEALAGVLLHGPQGMLAVLLGLVLVKERHDLAHHGAHWIIAQLLGDRHDLHAVLGQLPDVELELELVAEEP